MATPEHKVKQAVKKILDNYKPDCWYFMPAARVFGTAGIPDFICCYHGHFFSIETKAGHNKPSSLQVMQMKKIQAAGGTTFVINEGNIADITDFMERGNAMSESG